MEIEDLLSDSNDKTTPKPTSDISRAQADRPGTRILDPDAIAINDGAALELANDVLQDARDLTRELTDLVQLYEPSADVEASRASETLSRATKVIERIESALDHPSMMTDVDVELFQCLFPSITQELWDAKAKLAELTEQTQHKNPIQRVRITQICEVVARITSNVFAGAIIGRPATTVSSGEPGLVRAISEVKVMNNLTEQQYRAAFMQLVNSLGYGLVEVCGYEVNNEARFAAIWERRHGSRPSDWQWSGHAIRAADYQGVVDQRKSEGFRPARINGYTVAGQTFFNAIWTKLSGAEWGTRHNFHILNFANHLREIRRQGFRIVDISLYPSFEPNPDHTGPPPAPYVWINRFASIWEKSDGRDWAVSGPYSGDSHQQEFDRQIGLGRWPVQVSGSSTGSSGGEQRFIALWEKARGLPGVARHRNDAASYQADSDRLRNDGWRQLRVGAYSAGYHTQATARFNAIWERREAGLTIAKLAEEFMRRYEVPGLSMAIAKDGRLIFASGFGLADKTSGQRVTTSNLFRIASIAKPITSVAVMQLASEGRLALQDLVFGRSGHLKELGVPKDRRAENIIVRHLLEHSCGGWSNDNQDPMFSNPSLNQRQLISWVLANRNLTTAPGTAFAYSNFGYCVLGRIIEKVTGQSYDAYVRQHVLARCGITGMGLAGNTQAQRRPGEVVYYGLDGDDPYSMQVTRMDAHGGWLATPTDLLRFVVRVDGFSTPADILPADWIRAMTRPTGLSGSNGYANGWVVSNSVEWWHDGALPGTASVLVRAGDGYCWTALVNTGRRDKANPARDTVTGLFDLMWNVHDQVDVWPLNQPL